MRVLITGSSGFIGYHLSKSLLLDGYEIYGLDNLNNYYDVNLKKLRLNNLKSHENFKFKKLDLINYNDLEHIFKSFNPQKVINLAAQAGVRYGIKNPQAYIDSNLIGFYNILELSKHYETEGLIYASSSSVYGANNQIPFSTEHKTEKPMSLYAATKKSNELMAYAYHSLFGLNVTGLRFFTVYGPWGRPDMAYFSFTNSIFNDEKINVFNNGEMMRDFTYIDDIINGTRSAIEKNFPCEIFNLGNSQSENLMDVISILEHNIGKKARINFMPMQPGDVKSTYADIANSINKLGFSPRIKIEEGLKNFVEWYRQYCIQ